MSPEQLVQRECFQNVVSQISVSAYDLWSLKTTRCPDDESADLSIPAVAKVAYDEMVAISRLRLESDNDLPGAMIALASGRWIFFASSIKTGVGSYNAPVEQYHDNIMVEYFNNCHQQGSGRRKYPQSPQNIFQDQFKDTYLNRNP